MKSLQIVAIALVALMGPPLVMAPANATTFDFSFSGGGYSGLGTFITSSISSPYHLTDATGTASDPFVNGGTSSTITGISGFNSANNKLYYPTQPYVDGRGVSFNTADGNSYNLWYAGSEYLVAANDANYPLGPVISLTVMALIGRPE